MTAQELKNSILQLAVQGKLVEQRPEEGTAKELLAGIKAEKEQLIKDKKIKKEKPLPEITDEEKPFDIPESWEWVRLTEVTFAVGNKSNQIQTKEILLEGEIPVVSQGQSLIDGYSTQIEKMIDELPLVMFGDHTKNVKYIDFPFIIGADGTKFHKCIVVNPKYVFYWMKYVVINMRDRGYARHYTILKETLMSLPPLEEQKRIVSKIEEILPYIEQYDKAYTKLEAFNKKFPEDMKKSVLQLAMQGKLVEQRPEEGTAEDLYKQIVEEKAKLIKEGKIKKEKPLPEITEEEIPFEIPASWKWVRLSSICNVSDGTHQTPTYVEEGMPFISAQNIKPFKFMPQSYRCVSRDAYEEYNKMVAPNKGDILMTRVGAGIGESAIIDVDMQFSIYVSLTLIKCYFKEYDMKYLLYVLNSPHGRKLAEKKTLGKSASQGNLNLIFIREFLIPLPPLEEQKRIVARLEEILPYCNQLVK